MVGTVSYNATSSNATLYIKGEETELLFIYDDVSNTGEVFNGSAVSESARIFSVSGVSNTTTPIGGLFETIGMFMLQCPPRVDATDNCGE